MLLAIIVKREAAAPIVLELLSQRLHSAPSARSAQAFLHQVRCEGRAGTYHMHTVWVFLLHTNRLAAHSELVQCSARLLLLPLSMMLGPR